MIRNVVMAKLLPDADLDAVGALLPRFEGPDCPGTVAYTIGLDAGLRDGNWSLAIVADFDDAEAYRDYDLDAEHNRLRAELAAHTESVARLQFELG